MTKEKKKQTTDPNEDKTLEPISSFGEVSLIQGHIPEANEVIFSVENYDILSTIGKGGMGEVYLAYDRNCGRRLALKRIREDLLDQGHLQERFLREARITSQLTHPAIIPIFSIHTGEKLLYYTMPYIEGETLKEILRVTRRQEKKGEPLHSIGGSIPALLRIFTTVCQALGYSHSKGVLHRDLKPENIMVGKYGEVMILDWGLAKIFEEPTEPDELKGKPGENPKGITRHNRVVGTLTYMAPERALGQPATVQSDIYALGVMLYQILTLRSPFKRETLKAFKKNMDQEELIDPEEVAPYRDVPPVLTQIVKHCLSRDIDQRYQSVDDLIHDLDIFLEGRAEWFHVCDLDLTNKEDWQFQEHVIWTDHMEITRNIEASEWVTLMISRASLPDHVKLEASIRFTEETEGIGFLLSVPESSEREHLNDGYYLWLAAEGRGETKLLRTGVEVVQSKDIALKPNVWYRIGIEKVENNLKIFINDILQFSYISHLPIVGTHVGLLSRDSHFEIKDFHLFARSQSLMVNCLAIPDAFLAYKEYEKALSQYRRIGYSFPGRAEGREALFRAGVTLLESGKYKRKHGIDFPDEDFELALEEFTKLHNTPGAPLEYLGKALVYRTLEEYEEETKCYELALRRYPMHPLIHLIQEQIVQRMHETSRKHRLATYTYALLTVRYLSSTELARNATKLFDSLEGHWETLPFIIPDEENRKYQHAFAITLAFWCAKPFILEEIIDDVLDEEKPSPTLIGNALISLAVIGEHDLAYDIIDRIRQDDKRHERLLQELCVIQNAVDIGKLPLKEVCERLAQQYSAADTRLRFQQVYEYLIEEALARREPALARKLFKTAPRTEENTIRIACYEIWADLLENKLQDAGEKLHEFDPFILSDDTQPLHFLYGCWLEASEGTQIAQAHFFGVLDMAYPHLWGLLSHYLTGKIRNWARWKSRAFYYEKKMLNRQLSLYFHCKGDLEKADEYGKNDIEKVDYV